MPWWIVLWAAWLTLFLVGLDAVWRLVVAPFAVLAPAAGVAWFAVGLVVTLAARKRARRRGTPA